MSRAGSSRLLQSFDLGTCGHACAQRLQRPVDPGCRCHPGPQTVAARTSALAEELLLEYRGGAGAGVPLLSYADRLLKPNTPDRGLAYVEEYANHGLAVEKVMEVYAEFGPEVAKQFAEGMGAVMWEKLREGGVGGVEHPRALVEFVHSNSAVACAKLLWTFLEREQYRMTGGPAEVRNSQGARVGAVDGTLLTTGGRTVLLEIQCVTKCGYELHRTKVEQKRTKVAKVCAEVLRSPGMQARRVKTAGLALICTVQVDLDSPEKRPELSAELFDAQKVEDSKQIRKWAGWQEDTDPEPPRKRQRRASTVRNGLKEQELLEAISDSDRVPGVGAGYVLLKSYVALRWTQATAGGKLAEKVDLLCARWGWTLGQEVRLQQLNGGGKPAFVCKRATLRAAHRREHSL